MSGVPSALRRRLYAFAFVDELGPLYAVFPLWFAANGLSTAQISVAYMIWAGGGVILEVPSGALADRIDRRKVVGLGLILRFLGIAIWMVWPTFIGVLLGAMLWAMHTSLASGAWEALVYDALEEDEGSSDAYAEVMARLNQANYLAIALATAFAAVMLWAGWSMPVVGWFTASLHLPALMLLMSLPAARPVDVEGPTFKLWWQALRHGTRTAITRSDIGRLVLLGAVFEGLFILDDYVHLAARSRGASDAVVPIAVLAVWVGLLAGGELAARRTRMSPTAMGALLVVTCLVAALGLASGTIWGVALIGVAYGGLNTVWVLSDARFQERIPDVSRATVTSVRSVFSAAVSVMAFAGVGLMAAGDDPTPGLFVALGFLVAAGFLTTAWVPAAVQRESPASREAARQERVA